jgi:acyl carrier protein
MEKHLMKQQIYQQLKDLLVNYFELPESMITPETDLYEELELDSIDAIDLMVKLRELTNLDIEPDAFKKIRTVGDVVNELQQSQSA